MFEFILGQRARQFLSLCKLRELPPARSALPPPPAALPRRQCLRPRLSHRWVGHADNVDYIPLFHSNFDGVLPVSLNSSCSHTRTVIAKCSSGRHDIRGDSCNHNGVCLCRRFIRRVNAMYAVGIVFRLSLPLIPATVCHPLIRIMNCLASQCALWHRRRRRSRRQHSIQKALPSSLSLLVRAPCSWW